MSKERVTKSRKRRGHKEAQDETSRLRRDIVKHISELGLPASNGASGALGEVTKEAIRLSHSHQRRAVFEREYAAFGKMWPELSLSIANGIDVDPNRIEPELVSVDSGRRSGFLFRFACLLWSVPVSRGYGRRMRYLVKDKQNGMLIGLFALNDPVFNLRARDEWIGWDVDDRRERLVNLMDAYVVGATPPYSNILGGKLVASLMGSREVANGFRAKYAKTKGIISKKKKDPHLTLITVTSALGRSSIYNRLRLRKQDGSSSDSKLVELVRLGETQGFGHFQLSDDLFARLRRLLQEKKHTYADGHQFGQGPNWRIRVIREGLKLLDLDQDLLRHGVHREVYAMPLAGNFRAFLKGQDTDLDSELPGLQEISSAALRRWVIPRSNRDKTYANFTRQDLWDLIAPDEQIADSLKKGVSQERLFG